jgi:hypothetical protein
MELAVPFVHADERNDGFVETALGRGFGHDADTPACRRVVRRLLFIHALEDGMRPCVNPARRAAHDAGMGRGVDQTPWRIGAFGVAIGLCFG